MIEHDDFCVVPYFDMENIVEQLKSLKWTSHYECEDGWYSCPMSENYYGPETEKNCTCGADIQNKKIDDILELLKQ